MAKTRLYSDIAESLSFAGSMCLVHLGALHRTSHWQTDLRSELASLGLAVRLAEASAESISRVTADEPEGEILQIEDLRPLVNKATCADTLQRMRPALIEARRKGWRVLLLSTVPPDLYPALAGSSILMDASLVQGRPLENNLAEEYVRNLGVSHRSSVANIVLHAGGSRALLQAFSAIELKDTSGNNKRTEATKVEHKVAELVLDEIGSSLCMWLEHWVFECDRDEVYETDIATNYLVALRSAGVITPAADGAFTIFPFTNKASWVEVLGRYLESVVEPPPLWPELASELFSLERELRAAIRRTFADSNDLESALAQYGPRILELARRDSVPAAISLADVRSPLDWLTLSDLIGLSRDRAAASASSRVCGYTADEWEKLGREVVPIRNRVAHMRLARQGDLDVVRRSRRLWNLVLSRHS